ncbi:unnamed protein product [Rhizophagus irregularis]|nr:unnamed protein product [Rhizophagus irregularis]CAB5310575.1 unnamed protein product [Rhizophagus irregularis]
MLRCKIISTTSVQICSTVQYYFAIYFSVLQKFIVPYSTILIHSNDWNFEQTNELQTKKNEQTKRIKFNLSKFHTSNLSGYFELNGRELGRGQTFHFREAEL